ncbi:MAG: hypothetical protein J6O40_06365 [Ruminococcus sp.]|nr:hypothetical protein [Ruminococcus sp.]
MESRMYKIVMINGDYCDMVEMNTGEPITIAMALLPEEIEEGGTVLYENFIYTYIG